MFLGDVYEKEGSFKEVDLYLKLPNVGKTIRNKFKSHKPFWCEEITMV